MSRDPLHRKRRCYFLWLPIAIIGCAIYIYSLGLTLTANGLTVIGLAIIAARGRTSSQGGERRYGTPELIDQSAATKTTACSAPTNAKRAYRTYDGIFDAYDNRDHHPLHLRVRA